MTATASCRNTEIEDGSLQRYYQSIVAVYSSGLDTRNLTGHTCTQSVDL